MRALAEFSHMLFDGLQKVDWDAARKTPSKCTVSMIAAVWRFHAGASRRFSSECDLTLTVRRLLDEVSLLTPHAPGPEPLHVSARPQALQISLFVPLLDSVLLM